MSNSSEQYTLPNLYNILLAIMMMERAKTAPAPEESTQSNTNSKSSAPSTSTQPTEERVNDIQRRLNNLDKTTNAASSNGNVESDVVKSGQTLVEQAKQQSQTGKNNPLLVSYDNFRTAPV